MAMHPHQGLVAAFNQALGKIRVATILRDATKIVVEPLPRVAAEIRARHLGVRQLRHDPAQVRGTAIDGAHGTGGEARVAAPSLVWGPFEQRHLGALLPRRQRGTERRIAPAYHHDMACSSHIAL